MTDFAAIIASPEDLDARRAVANRLVAEGDPRGDFILLQLDAAQERIEHGETADYLSWSQTARAIQQRHGSEWAKDIAPYVASYMYSRGFVERVTMDAERFLENGEVLYRLAPIRSVVLTNARPVIDSLCRSALLDRLVEISLFDNRLGDEGVAVLVRSAHLSKLRILDLGFNDITASGLDALAAAPTLRHLVWINLAGNRFPLPSEYFAVDPMSARMVRGSARLPPLGEELESKHGELQWLHAPSRALSSVPTFEDV